MTEFDSLAGFRQAVVATVVQAAQDEARELWLCDADFEGWPLDDPALLAALSTWVRLPGRCLRMLGVSYEGLRRRCPRFTQWRTTWGHVVDARVPEEGHASWTGCIVVDARRVLRLRDRDDFRGDVVSDRASVVHVTGQIDAVWQRGTPGFAASVLGL